MKVIDMPDFELPPPDAYIEPGLNPQSTKVKPEKSGKKKKDQDESPQFLFSRLLAKDGRYHAADGIIYEWIGTHWHALTGSQPERLALKWLFCVNPGKASDKLAASCASTAALSLPDLPARDSSITLIPCKSGTLEVTSESVKLRASAQRDGLTYCLECEYDPLAPRPIFDRFIVDALPNESVRDWLQEFAGYTLISDTRHQIACWLLGRGGNGKGVFVEVLSALHARVAASHIGAGDMTGFGMENLIGASLVLVDETPQRIDEQRLKTLISGDAIRIDRKYREPITLRSHAKWIVNGNSLPAISDQSDGFWRRLVVVRFDYQPATPTPLLGKLIVKSDLNGFLNWTIDGLQRLLRRGHFPVLPDALSAEKRKARLAANNVANWLDECDVEILDKPHDGPLAGMPKQTAYLSYSLWCKSSGTAPVSAFRFWERVKTQHPGLREFRRGDGRGTSRVRCVNVFVPTPCDE